MEQQQLISILTASFEAGLLLNNESGKILHVNTVARELLLGGQATEGPSEISLAFTDKYNHSISWENVKHVTPDVTFMVSCKDSKPAEARLASVGDLYSLLFLSPKEDTTDDSTDDASSMASNVLASILDASLDPIFQVNEEGIIRRVNNAATTQFGWTKDEFLGQNISMIVGEEHAARHDQYMERYLLTGEKRVMGTKRELPARRKDKSEFPILLSLVEVQVPVKQQQGEERMFCGFIVDLTKQKELLSHIESERNLMKEIIDASLDPFFQINDGGIIMMVNEAAIAQFQWTREELVGNNIKMIVGKEHADRHDQYMERYRLTGETRVMNTRRILQARRKDESEFMIQLSLVEVEHCEERLFCAFILDLPELDHWMSEASGNGWCC